MAAAASPLTRSCHRCVRRSTVPSATVPLGLASTSRSSCKQHGRRERRRVACAPAPHVTQGFTHPRSAAPRCWRAQPPAASRPPAGQPAASASGTKGASRCGSQQRARGKTWADMLAAPCVTGRRTMMPVTYGPNTSASMSSAPRHSASQASQAALISRGCTKQPPSSLFSRWVRAEAPRNEAGVACGEPLRNAEGTAGGQKQKDPPAASGMTATPACA